MSFKITNKTISDSCICSRRKAEILIRDKKVLINGIIIEIVMKVNPGKINILKKELNHSFHKIVFMERGNRQIRRSISLLVSKVIDLQRNKVGKISLGKLKIGELRKIESSQLRKHK